MYSCEVSTLTAVGFCVAVGADLLWINQCFVIQQHPLVLTLKSLNSDCHRGPHLPPRSTSPSHLPLWSLSPTGEKWAPAFQQCWELITRIQSSPSSFFPSLTVFLAICFGLFFPKMEVAQKCVRKLAGESWGNKDLEIVLGPHSSSPPSPKRTWNCRIKSPSIFYLL